jgi:hypothetical protein
MAEFVTKTIDNASHGVTVKDAIEYLKLCEFVLIKCYTAFALMDDWSLAKWISYLVWKCAYFHIN